MEMDLEVTWIHQLKKKGKSSTLTRPFRVRAVHGLCGLALLNVDPKRINETKNYQQKEKGCDDLRTKEKNTEETSAHL